MDNQVLLKGERDGLLLVVNGQLAFGDILLLLKKKLDAASEFFAKSPNRIALRYNESSELSFTQSRELSDLLAGYGIIYDPLKQEPPASLPVQEEKHGVPFVAPEDAVTSPTLMLYRTLRGGQEIRYSGSVVVVGDVNPTARIFAENDILVTGSTRGVLHAGALGDRSAIVTAGQFSGGQIRIADLIVRAPDTQETDSGPERAKVLDGQIVIDTIH